MTAIVNFVSAHWAWVTAFAVAFWAALATSLPRPGEPFSWYEVFYNMIQALLPIRVRVTAPHSSAGGNNPTNFPQGG